jgi:type IX secretion system PorP/SprF family membrane protein
LDKWKSGIGVNYSRGEIGFSVEHKAVLTYAYHLQFKDESTLSFGAAAGIQSHRVVGGQLIFPDGSQEALNGYTKSNFIADFGIHFKKEHLSLGLSSTGVNQPLIGYYYQAARHYYLTGSYDFELSEKWILQPKLMGVNADAMYSAHFHLLASYNKFLTFGAGYRFSDAICVNASYQFKEKIKIGYAYDHTRSKLSNISRGSHEIMLGITF